MIKEVADKLISGIKFTVDLPETNRSGRCPMLDLEVWLDNTVEGGKKIRHRFYEKPMASPLVFRATSAYTEQRL